MLLEDFVQDIKILKGIGPKTAGHLKRVGIKNISSLLKYFPREYIDRSNIKTIIDSINKDHSVCIIKVVSHQYFGRKNILKIEVKDNSAAAYLICFGRNFLSSSIIPGKSYIFYGSFNYKYSEIQSSNFDLEEYSPENTDYAKMLPVYRLTSGITQNIIRKAIKAGFEYIKAINPKEPLLDEELPASILKKYNFNTVYSNFYKMHFPLNKENINKAYEYFIYKELFYLLFKLKSQKYNQKNKKELKNRKSISFLLKKQLIARLSFSLTKGQKKAISEIEKGLFSNLRMSKILQGDVGCGKTLVSVVAAISVIEAGEQAAFMAPTSLLAKQHAETISSLLAPLGVRIALLTGSVKPEKRRLLLNALRKGKIDLIIGTHALTSQDVEFKSLGLAIIDEQHRFGVLRRSSLVLKGQTPDLLLMTATPIPRTLALTIFDELEISTIKTMPAGRKPVITHLTVHGNEQKVYNAVKKELDSGRQAYFVYPLINESEKLKLKTAEDMYNNLKNYFFPDKRIALIHSKTDEQQAEKIMRDFISGNIDVLVSTTIVEVGVDVPNATCMIIEHAERFGLATLHQLRGRVGRGKYQSYAFLIYSKELTDNSIKRLRIMKETTDGFKIADEDLKIRGPGNILGIMQSGFPDLIVADLSLNMNVLLKAKEDIENILKSDYKLKSGENRPIREVLKILDRNQN